MPSRHSIPQDLYKPLFNFMNYARTMFTPTMGFSRTPWVLAEHHQNRGYYKDVRYLLFECVLMVYIYIYIYRYRHNNNTIDISYSITCFLFNSAKTMFNPTMLSLGRAEPAFPMA